MQTDPVLYNISVGTGVDCTIGCFAEAIVAVSAVYGPAGFFAILNRMARAS